MSYPGYPTAPQSRSTAEHNTGKRNPGQGDVIQAAPPTPLAGQAPLPEQDTIRGSFTCSSRRLLLAFSAVRLGTLAIVGLQACEASASGRLSRDWRVVVSVGLTPGRMMATLANLVGIQYMKIPDGISETNGSESIIPV